MGLTWGRRQGDLLEEHQDMICKFILLGLAGLTLAGEPDVFQNYFDDTIKEVDIPLDAAIKGCLQNGNTFADKVKKAYADCFGSADYDFGDLAAKEGSADSDKDGLPDSFENNEQCFYKKMGWVNGAGDLSPDAIKGDLAGLETGAKTEFDGNIDKCASWNGDFGSRRKREAGDSETEEEASNVPSVMESGSAALGWLKAAVRKTRSADPKKQKRSGKKKNKNRNNNAKKKNKNKRSKKTKRGGKKKTKRGGNKKTKRKGKGRNNKKTKRRGGNRKTRKNKRNRKTRKGKKNQANGRKSRPKGRKNKRNRKQKRKGKNSQGNRRNGRPKNRKSGSKKRGNGKGKGKQNNRNSKQKGKGKKRGDRNNKGKGGKKGGKNSGKNSGNEEKKGARNNKGMDVSTYNKLWCFDLSLEQILEKCVENKIKN